jgi:hypothetical protein
MGWDGIEIENFPNSNYYFDPSLGTKSRTLSRNFQYLMHENLSRDNHFQSKRLQIYIFRLNIIIRCRHMKKGETAVNRIKTEGKYSCDRT